MNKKQAVKKKKKKRVGPESSNKKGTKIQEHNQSPRNLPLGNFCKAKTSSPSPNSKASILTHTQSFPLTED